MHRKNVLFTLVLALLIATVIPLHAKKKDAIAVPSLTKGDPPPGNAMALSVPQARATLKEAIKKRYVGTLKGLALTVVVEEATDAHFSFTGFELAAASTAKVSSFPQQPRDAGKFSVVLRMFRITLSPVVS